MKAMILAAGRGKRMRPLTDSQPKPLLEAGGKPLIEWHLEKLADAGCKEVVINTAWQASKLHKALGSGKRWGVRILWSDEPEGGLETAGGVLHALPHLGDDPFILVNGDIWTDYDFAELPNLSAEALGHLVLVDNPPHHPNGDFVLESAGNQLSLRASEQTGLTFSGVSVLHPQLFAGHSVGFLPLRPCFEKAIQAKALTGEHYAGHWTDAGTPQRLQELNALLGKPQ